MYSIIVWFPTPPSVKPLISLSAPMFVPPWRMEMYFNVPELSLSLSPPYCPLSSVVGIPSMLSVPGIVLSLPLPKTITPPQSPRSFFEIEPFKSSAKAVKIIGS